MITYVIIIPISCAVAVVAQTTACYNNIMIVFFLMFDSITNFLSSFVSQRLESLAFLFDLPNLRITFKITPPSLNCVNNRKGRYILCKKQEWQFSLLPQRPLALRMQTFRLSQTFIFKGYFFAIDSSYESQSLPPMDWRSFGTKFQCVF